MPPLSLLIKPASSLCNLRCGYCFYHQVAGNRTVPDFGIMTPEVTEILVKRACEEARGHLSVAFQGGEPSLAGLAWFQMFHRLMDQYRPAQLKVSFAFQTNGMTMDDAWCRFFLEHNYLVGLSLDGDKEMHDAMRSDPTGKGTHFRVMETAALFRKTGVAFNVLTVIHSGTARRGAHLYQWLRKQGFSWLQFIPCLEDLHGEKASSHALTPERYGRFLSVVFDLWERDLRQGQQVSIRYFDNLVMMLMGHPPESCAMAGQCGHYLVVESDGSVYPCDFYTGDGHRLGNLTDTPLTELLEMPSAVAFRKESHLLHEECRVCTWLPLCRGGCRRDREPMHVGKSIWCEASKAFFSQHIRQLQSVAALFSRGGPAGNPPTR